MPEQQQTPQPNCQNCKGCACNGDAATQSSEVSAEFKRPDDTEGGSCD